MLFSKLKNIQTFVSSNSCQNDQDESVDGLENSLNEHCSKVFNFSSVPRDFQLPSVDSPIYHKDSKDMDKQEKRDLIHTMLRTKMDEFLSRIAKDYEKGKLKMVRIFFISGH
jgi:hypothetical protein